MSRYQRDRESSDYASILRAVKTPLTFFALALLIVEGFLTAVILTAGFERNVKLGLTITGICLFILVCIMVFVLAWRKPEGLMSDKDSYK